MKSKLILKALLPVLFGLLTAPAFSKIVLLDIFSDHAVLQ